MFLSVMSEKALPLIQVCAVAAQLPPVTEDEARRHLEGLREAAGEARRVRLRGLMLESAEEAERVYDQIRRRRITFNEAVVRHETATGQGVSLELGWDDLWEEQRAALEKLRPGQVSRPISRSIFDSVSADLALRITTARFWGSLQSASR